jgi:UDP-N-acetylmuramate--alanine ligase
MSVPDAESNPNTQECQVTSDPVFGGRYVHLLGIGGSGMSGLAELIRNRGGHCSGTDLNASEGIERLRALGITVDIGEPSPEASLPEHCDLVIASAAIKPDHPLMVAAELAGVETISYAEAVGRAQIGRTAVSISGTHGKSTTTSMLAHILVECGLDPSFIAGAHCPQLGGGARVGTPRIKTPDGNDRPGIFVAEACEFNRSFHHHHPTIALINNLEEDHLDIYNSIDEIVVAFHEFAQLLPKRGDGGRLLINHESAHRRGVTAGLECDVQTFGFSPSADYQVFLDAPAQRVGILQDGNWVAQWDTQVPGDHNALNAAAAAIIASWLGADWDGIAAALGGFKGVTRRLERLGTRKSRDGGTVTVFDDYGHHPSECDATLRAIHQAEKPQRLICVFQPHQHSRTRFLLDQFAHSFSRADIVIVPPIYFVRDSEEEKRRISSADLVDRLRERGVTAMHLHPFEAIIEQLDVLCEDGDLVVVMGAGPVWQIGHEFLKRGTPAHQESNS